MDSELPHCTICLKSLSAGWRCAEHSNIDIPEKPTMFKNNEERLIAGLQKIAIIATPLHSDCELVLRSNSKRVAAIARTLLGDS